MKPLNRDTFSDLQDFFIGGLNEPVKVWVTRVREPHLHLNGPGVDHQGGEWILDYGSVPAVGTIRRRVSIENAGQGPLKLDVEGDSEDWLKHRWKKDHSQPCLKGGGDRAVLEVFFQGREIEEQRLTALLRIRTATDSGVEKTFPLRIRVNAHIRFAHGLFDFNGKADREPYDFGLINPVKKGEKHQPYRLSIENRGTEPLEMTIDTSSEWLTVETINVKPSRNGLNFRVHPGETSITVIRPIPSKKFMGINKGEIILRSNDTRKKYQEFDIPFQCVQEIQEPYITFKKPQTSIEIVPHRPYAITLSIYNRGKTEAQLFVASQSQYVQSQPALQVPGAVGQKPGKAPLPVTIQADSEVPPGPQTMNLELRLVNGNQKPLHIPVEIYAVKIEWEPESLDFGEVNFGETRNLPVTFKPSDDRELLMWAKPEPVLQDDLSVKMVNDHTLEVILEDIPISSNKTYEGPGIIVYDSQLGYEERLFVKFRRTTPIFDADPREIDMGNIVGGAKASGSFKVFNRGDGLLKVVMSPDSEKLSIEGPFSFNMPPEKEVDVKFTLDLRENDEPIRHSIFINTNDPAAEPAEEILIRGDVLRPEGKVCPKCSLVVSLNDAYCPICGEPVQDVPPVSKTGLTVCPKCKRKFKTESPFCSQDGKRLKPLDA